MPQILSATDRLWITEIYNARNEYIPFQKNCNYNVLGPR